MVRGPIPRSPEEETGRETRLRLVLLAVALVLVAVYAATVTSMGDVVFFEVGRLLNSGHLTAIALYAVGAAVALGAGYLAYRHWASLPRRKAAAPKSVPILGSRKAFTDALAAQIAAHTEHGRQLAVHAIDIDRFRALNESLGEAEGDAFLRLVGERLLVLVDDVGRLARIGDDEFAIIQPDVSGVRHAEIYARRLQEVLRDACAQVPHHARPSASIGIAVFPDHGEEPLKLLQCASLAQDSVKKAGGGDICVYAREMEMAIDSRLELERAISDGLSEGWFDLHFQPQYDLRTRRLTGFEALARLTHPKLGDIAPAVFLPVANESGLIQPLGEWVIHDALKTAAEWPAHLVLSINLSLAQFQNGDIAASVLQALGKSGFQARRLRVEVPEAALVEDTPAINAQLQRLKAHGVSIVLDDFGVESTRLKLLARSPLSAVKLDRSLVERVGDASDMDDLVSSLIGTAHSFNLDILAEGIERAEQAHFLVSHDCSKVQGYLFSRPVPARELAALIAKDAKHALGATGSLLEASELDAMDHPKSGSAAA